MRHLLFPTMALPREFSVFRWFLKNGQTDSRNSFCKMTSKKLSLREVKRLQIKTLHKAGKKLSKIAKILKCCRKTVFNTLKRKIIVDKKNPKRAVNCTPTTSRVIRKQLRENPNGSLPKCARVLNYSESYQNRGKKISKNTIYRKVKKTPWGKKAYKVWPVHLLTPKNITDRLSLGRKVTEW